MDSEFYWTCVQNTDERLLTEAQKQGGSKRAASSKPTPTEMTTKPGYVQHIVQSEGSFSV